MDVFGRILDVFGRKNKNLKKLGKNNIYNFRKELNNLFKRKENIETFLNGEELIRYF